MWNQTGGVTKNSNSFFELYDLVRRRIHTSAQTRLRTRYAYLPYLQCQSSFTSRHMTPVFQRPRSQQPPAAIIAALATSTTFVPAPTLITQTKRCPCVVWHLLVSSLQAIAASVTPVTRSSPSVRRPFDWSSVGRWRCCCILRG